MAMTPLKRASCESWWQWRAGGSAAATLAPAGACQIANAIAAKRRPARCSIAAKGQKVQNLNVQTVAKGWRET
jgi:hypothetical protein